MTAAGTYCIIGGTGFLGTALRRRLHALQRPVVVVGRAPSADLLEGERYVASATLSEFAANSGQERFAAVVDLAYASVPSTSIANPIADIAGNLRSVVEHLEAARAIGADRYLFVSSGGTVYGDSTGGAIAETAPQRPISPYGISKLACEHYALMVHHREQLPALIVRPSNVYGPGQRPFRGQGLVATALAAALKGTPLTIYGDGSQVRDFLYVDDFCDGLLAVLDQGLVGEVYNLGSGQGLTIGDVLNQVSSIVAGDGHRLVMDRQEGRPFDVHSNVLDIAKLRQATGWQPRVPFRDGLEQAWRWIRQA